MIDRVDTLCAQLEIPSRLGELIPRFMPGEVQDAADTDQMISGLVASSKGNSLQGNPRQVEEQALRELLHEMW